jgi:hypothetical protein
MPVGYGGPPIMSGLARATHEASDLCDDQPYLKKPSDPAQLVREIRRLLAAQG